MRQGKADASCREEIILAPDLASQTAHSVIRHDVAQIQRYGIGSLICAS
jgi:hypothetical protein